MGAEPGVVSDGKGNNRMGDKGTMGDNENCDTSSSCL